MKIKDLVMIELLIALFISIPLSVPYLMITGTFSWQILIVMGAIVGLALSGAAAALLAFVSRKAPYRMMMVALAVCSFYALLALSGSLFVALGLAIGLVSICSTLIEQYLWKKYLRFSIGEFDESVSMGIAWVKDLERSLSQIRRLSAHENPASAHKLARSAAELAKYLVSLDERSRRIEGIKIGRDKRKTKPRNQFNTELERKAWWHTSLQRLELLHNDANKFGNSLHDYLESNSDSKEDLEELDQLLKANRRLSKP